MVRPVPVSVVGLVETPPTPIVVRPLTVSVSLPPRVALVNWFDSLTVNDVIATPAPVLKLSVAAGALLGPTPTVTAPREGKVTPEFKLSVPLVTVTVRPVKGLRLPPL